MNILAKDPKLVEKSPLSFGIMNAGDLLPKMSPPDLFLGWGPPAPAAESATMPPQLDKRDFIFLILQFLDEEKYSETVHKLEQESGLYFNMKHFEDVVLAGDWDEAENYLSAFIKVHDSRHSRKIFFDIRKHKFFEALDRGDRPKALEILNTDLKVFEATHPELFMEMTQLLTVKNYRENSKLALHGDAKSVRAMVLSELKKIIAANPLLRDKLQFPISESNALRNLFILSTWGSA